jgi:hypothetical protein
MIKTDLFKVIVFVVHYFSFLLTVLFYVLKFHKKGKLNIAIFSVAALWIVFGGIDFILELKSVLAMFRNSSLDDTLTAVLIRCMFNMGLKIL